LVVPHAARLLVGADFRRVLPLAALLGAAFMVLVDWACRGLASIEIAPGIVTALLGAPVFVWLLARRCTVDT
jgi:iron complex transport system permease protein